MLLTFQWIWAIKKALEPEPLRSVAVGDNPSHRVKATHPHRRLTSIYDNVDTLHMLQLRAFTLYAHKRCMGTRVYFGQLNPKVKKFGDVIWRTFEDVGKDSHRFGAALRASGLVAAPRQTTLDKLSDPCSLALYENTCAEWMVAAMGCFTQSMAITTIYATLGIQAVVDAINDGVIAAMLCNKRSVSEVVSHAKNMPTLKTIIYTSDMIGPDEDIKLPSTTNDMRIISFEDFVKSGDMEKYQPVKPSPNTTAVIMYTSGSTGKPKGVIATHSNILAAVASGQDLIGIKEGGEVYLGYLPLAHILELMAEIAMIGLGNTIC